MSPSPTSIVTSDFLRPARLQAEQERQLGPYLAADVRPFSDHYRPVLQRATWPRRGPGLEDLARLAVTEMENVGDPSALVLRPDAERIRQDGGRGMRLRLRAAEALGYRKQFGRTRIDPVYKPVRWTVDEGLLLAYSAVDVERLAEIGRRWLEAAGIRPDDSLVSMVRPGPSLAFLELELGARRAGLSALFLPAPPSVSELAQLRPEVLAGSADDLLRLLLGAKGDQVDVHQLRTVLAVGAPLKERDRRLLQDLAPRAAVLQAWAPAGVRSLWFECRGGTGLHTQPGAEILEVVVPPDDRPAVRGQYGDLLWTALGWRGSALLRLRTGLLGGVDPTVCTACGRGSPRVRVPAFIEVLDDADDLAEWQVELVSGPVRGRDEVIAYVAPAGRMSEARIAAVVQGLHDRLHAQGQTVQFVVESEADVRARVEEVGGARLVDLRE